MSFLRDNPDWFNFLKPHEVFLFKKADVKQRIKLRKLAAQRRYRKTEKGKAAHHRYNLKFNTKLTEGIQQE